MTLRTRKRLLTLLSLCLLTLCAGVVAWGLSEPQLASESRQPHTPQPSEARSPVAGEEPRVTASDFDPHWDRPLRRALYDPPPPVPKPVEKPPLPPLRAKLLATIIEPNGSQAMLELNGGQVVFRRVGDIIGPENEESTVSEILPGVIVVKRGDEQSRLSVE